MSDYFCPACLGSHAENDCPKIAELQARCVRLQLDVKNLLSIIEYHNVYTDDSEDGCIAAAKKVISDRSHQAWLLRREAGVWKEAAKKCTSAPSNHTSAYLAETFRARAAVLEAEAGKMEAKYDL